MADTPIKSFMHPFPHTIGTDQTLETAKQMLAEHRIRHLPVRAHGEIVGVLSDRDIHFTLGVEKVEATQVKVQDTYTREPYTVTPETSAAEVARRMARDHLGCAIILDKGELVGIFTTTDACRALAETLSATIEQ